MKKLAQVLIEQEKLELTEMLSTVFGYHIVQLGDLADGSFMTSGPIKHRTMLTERPYYFPKISSLVSKYSQLPFLSNSIDAFILPHTLEMDLDASSILDEVWRTLMPQGQAFILGFNPNSLWGLVGLMKSIKKIFPWHQHFMSKRKIESCLKQSGFEIVTTKTFFYRPLVIDQTWLSRLRILEIMGRFAWPYCGSIYLYQVQKQVACVTPMRLGWEREPNLSQVGGIQPTRRGSLSD
ncbi:MAG: methyltransferase domain-containing protein [Gammaproteobacteria bacterium]